MGSSLRRNVCFQRGSRCEDCIIANNCPYSRIYHPGPVDGADYSRGYTKVPPPYVIEPPSDTAFQAGDNLNMDLVLVGRSTELLPYFIMALQRAGESGITSRKSRLRLVTVEGLLPESGSWKTIYDTSRDELEDDIPFIRADTFRFVSEPIADLSTNTELTAILETMTRLKFRGQYVTRVEFPVLLRAILRRITMLSECYCDGEFAFPDDLLDRASEVIIQEDHTQWYDWHRYSSRQNREMPLGGVIGSVRYLVPSDYLASVMPYLTLAHYIHAGKNTSFGLGKIGFKLGIGDPDAWQDTA